MKKYHLLVLSVFCLFSGAAELTVADGAKSDYQIVVPDATGDKVLDGYVTLGAKVIRTAVRKASGADLPLTTESKMVPGRPAIYVGNVEALKNAGLSSQDFVPWEHAVAVKGRNIFCYGRDLGNPFQKSDMISALRFPAYFIHFAPGSLKAACVFAEKFLNTRFVIPRHNAYGEHDGVRTRPLAKIAVPENYSFRRKVRFCHRGDTGGLLYCVANNFCFYYATASSVHNTVEAIPQNKYFKSNPEYFALIDGKRSYHKATAIYSARPQYCLSNPEVRELIYRHALKYADLGYKVVEFGQSDGFIGCECEKCKKLYDTSDWGEKLWHFNSDLARRLEKDRPGVIPAIACYGPTRKVPRTLKKFPTKNMIIDVAPPSKQLIEEWKKFNITGMAGWIYYFGSYKASSFAPSADFSFLKNELKWLRSTPITHLVTDGITVAPALNGPWVYAYGRFCDDPEQDTEKLLQEYCLFAYGDKAAPHMVKFFKLLDDRSRLFPPDQNEDYNDFNRRRQNSADLWRSRYTPEVLAELKSLFAAGEKTWIKSEFTERLKREFTYLVLTAEANNAGKALMERNVHSARLALADAIEKRNEFLENLPVRKIGGRKLITGIFSYPSMAALKAGGSMSGIFNSGINLDPRILRQERKSMTLTRVKDFSDPAWAGIPEQKMVAVRGGAPETGVSFKAGLTADALLLVCTAPLKDHPAGPAPARDDTQLWKEAVWEIFIANSSHIRQLAFSAQPRSAFDTVIYPRGARFDGWNGSWRHEDTVKDGVWRSEVTIPIADVSAARLPSHAGAWWMQVAFSSPGAREIFAWNPPLSGRLADLSGFGEVRFSSRCAKEHTVDINGDFSEKKLWKAANAGGTMEYILLDGKPAVKFGYENQTWGGLSGETRTPLAENEEALFTVTIRGRGKASLGAGWCNIEGGFAANTLGTVSAELSDQPQVLSLAIRLTPEIQAKGGVWFYPNIFIARPGGEAVVEKAELKVRRIW